MPILQVSLKEKEQNVDHHKSETILLPQSLLANVGISQGTGFLFVSSKFQPLNKWIYNTAQV